MRSRRFIIRVFKNDDSCVIGIAETMPDYIAYRAGLYFEKPLSWTELTRYAVKHVTDLLENGERAVIVSNIETTRRVRKRPYDTRVIYYFESDISRLKPAEHIAYYASLTGVSVIETTIIECERIEPVNNKKKKREKERVRKERQNEEYRAFRAQFVEQESEKQLKRGNRK